MKRLFIFIACIIVGLNLFSQKYTQTVRGIVLEQNVNLPVMYANVILTNDSLKMHTITNEDGEFRFENVPIGRKSIEVSCIGYETAIITNIDVTTGKEKVIEINMNESFEQLEEIEIRAYHKKEKPINNYAPVSARMFSIEESQRYAGSMNDVSKMAMNFAGVKLTAETTNEIVIRGNSPSSVVFRLEGVDIPNPNHFGDGGNSGGPNSMLNNNVLANSDFLTSAFPAEYSNTIAGVFDLRLRNGNTQKHEFMVQTGFMGLELGAEGPISKKHNSSYLLNYRYTNSKALEYTGSSIMGTMNYHYDDLTFKLNFPSKKMGTISIFGLGGRSFMTMNDSERDTTEEYQQPAYESDYEMDLLYDIYNYVSGISHSYIFGTSAYSKLTIAASSINNITRFDSLSTVNREKTLQYYGDFTRNKYMIRFYVNKKFGTRASVKTGFNYDIQSYQTIDSVFEQTSNQYRILRDGKGRDVFPMAYIQFNYNLTRNLTAKAGLSSLWQTSTINNSIEPRIGLSWEFLPKNTLSLAYGLHSVVTPIDFSNQQVILSDGTYITPNTDLDFTKSHHFVMGYDNVFSNKFRFKTEVYYQYIFNAVVEKESSSYSLLNRGAYTIPDVSYLTNDGKGYNYGVEFTAEKFMDKGFYFLSTLSLYEAKYKGSDGILRDNAFNSNFVLNILGGKEFTLGAKSENARRAKKITIDTKINWAGGQRYTPVDLQASRTMGYAVYEEEKAFSSQLPNYFRLDFRFGYKLIAKKATHQIALDIRNVTNRINPFYIRYDVDEEKLETKGFGMMPDLIYRINF